MSTFTNLRAFPGLAATVAAMLVVAAGCDLTGQYDKKLSQSLNEAKRKSAYDEYLHGPYTEVMDAARQPIGVKLRLPKKFDGESKALSQNVIPAATGLQGSSSYVLVRELDDNNGQKAACIASLVAIPKTDGKGEPIQNQIAKGLATTATGGKWEDVKFPSPSGQEVSLKRIRMEMRLPLPDAKGGVTAQNTRMDLYYVDSGNHTVLIMWMVPPPQAQKHDLEKAIEASMGTLEVAAAPGADGAAGGGAAPAGKAGCF